MGLVIIGLTRAVATPIDSLRMEYIDGQAYIIHQVDPGETLFSISKRYKVSMNAIAEASPEVKKGLQDGMILHVPYKSVVKQEVKQQTHTVAPGETLYSISRIYEVSVIEIMEWNDLLSSDPEVGQLLKIGGETPVKEIDFIRDGKKIHIIQASEGLYALARNYGVTVDELVEWNHLETSRLDMGQEIIVGLVGANPKEEGEAEDAKVVSEVPVTIETPVAKKIRHSENGIAAAIEGSVDDNTYLAMHRTIPVGSLVAVRNEMNNQVVFVRVVGTLPDTGINEKVIIRLSAAAVKQLRAIDPKFRVEISYLIPE